VQEKPAEKERKRESASSIKKENEMRKKENDEQKTQLI
jgi:hypothetical protein